MTRSDHSLRLKEKQEFFILWKKENREIYGIRLPTF